MRFPVRLAALAGALVLVPATTAAAAPIATDPLTNSSGQHHTIVEPDSFADGSTIVAAAQAGRFFGGGSNAITVAASSDSGGTWTSQLLPGITTFTTPAGPYDAVTDPSVAYDKAHDVWLVSSLGLMNGSGVAVLTSRGTRSTTTGAWTWSNPFNTAVVTKRQSFDKNWIVCDNTSTSPFYGSCYTQFDDFGRGNQLKMYYSRDGGQTWTASHTPNVGVIGGQPLVLSNGNVVVPLANAFDTVVGFTISTNGGVKYGQAFGITPIAQSVDPGQIRAGALPTAEIAGDDTIYFAWEDCRFRAGCPAAGTPNDIVYVTSSNNAKSWSTVKRVPIDATNSTVDHFLPGIAVDRATSGANTRLGLVYYYYPKTNCSVITCELNVGFVSSVNGGSLWSTPTSLAGPMSMAWLPDTSQGRMVGDYMSASFTGTGTGAVHPVYVAASAPDGGADCSISPAVCDQALFSDSITALGGNVPSVADTLAFTPTAGPGVSEFKQNR